MASGIAGFRYSNVASGILSIEAPGWAQLVEHATLDLRVESSSSMWDVELKIKQTKIDPQDFLFVCF